MSFFNQITPESQMQECLDEIYDAPTPQTETVIIPNMRDHDDGPEELEESMITA